MSEFEIHNHKDLKEAKRVLRKRLDRREILIRTNLNYFQDRWKDDRMGGSFPYKTVIMDGISVLVDAVYVLKAGTKNKTLLLIRFLEVGVHYISQRYLGRSIELLKQIIPFMKAGAEKTAKKDDEASEEE
ncbi:MAG: hypothetical protein ABEH38_03930 [Flavobacteriales bacterium]